MKTPLLRVLFVCSSFSVAACGGPLSGESEAPSVDKTWRAPLLSRPGAVRDEYIVVLRENPKGVASTPSALVARELVEPRGGQVLHTYGHALQGFAMRMSEARMRELLADPRVAYIERNGSKSVSASGAQGNATWGIDRIDQRALPLDSTYRYGGEGLGVHAYILDTGMRQTHNQFTGRVGEGFDAITAGGNANDCHGHGTHVAGTVGGTTWGVAKKVTLHPVRVLDCTGYGTDAQVIAGLDWVAAHHVKPAVANMSLGGDPAQAVDDAAERLIAAGVSLSVAAGNDGLSACDFSPARVPGALTVGALARDDEQAYFSNIGPCLDLYAPGMDITSAEASSNSASTTMSGTSMASPHVAGVAALYLEANPSATPAQVAAALVSNATPNRVSGADSTGSPNRLLYSAFITSGGSGGGGGTSDTTAPGTTLTSPTAGATVSGTVSVSATASDNVGVSRVEFYEGIRLLGTDTTAPYALDWNTTAVANGGYTLTTKAYDAAGNVGTSAPVSVTVNNVSTGNCSTTAQLLSNADFEGGAVAWTSSAGVIDGTGRGSAPRSGRYKARLNGYGDSKTETLQQTVSLPASACTATLSFWVKITTEEYPGYAYDKLAVQVLDGASGKVLATLATLSNLDASGDYVLKSFDLSAWRGQSVRVHFRGTEDVALATGFFLDDTAVRITR